MKKVTINVLASDFKDNYWMNMDIENGCPLQRAFRRSGLDLGMTGFYNGSDYFIQQSVQMAEIEVLRMFHGYKPIEDFSFEVEA